MIEIITGDLGNSYLTYEQIDEEINYDLRFDTEWNNFTTEEKKKIIIMSVKDIDKTFLYLGEKTNSSQNLEFPRHYDDCITQDKFFEDRDNIIPDEIKNAQIEQIKYILSQKMICFNDLIKQELGIQNTEFDVVRTSFFAQRNISKVNNSVMRLLSLFTNVCFSLSHPPKYYQNCIGNIVC